MSKNNENAQGGSQQNLQHPPARLQHAIITSTIQPRRGEAQSTSSQQLTVQPGKKSPMRLIVQHGTTGNGSKQPRSLTQQAEYYRKIQNQSSSSVSKHQPQPTSAKLALPAQPTLKTVARNYHTQASCLSSKSFRGRSKPATSKSKVQTNLSTGPQVVNVTDKLDSTSKSKEMPTKTTTPTAISKNGVRSQTQGCLTMCCGTSFKSSNKAPITKQQTVSKPIARQRRPVETVSCLQPVLSQKKKQSTTRNATGSLLNEARQGETTRLLLPQQNRKNLRRLASPKTAFKRNLNKSQEGIQPSLSSIHKTSSAAQIQTSRAQNSTSACAFQTDADKTSKLTNAAAARNTSARYQKLTRLNTAVGCDTSTENICTEQTFQEEQKEVANGVIKNQLSPQRQQSQSEPFEISPLRNDENGDDCAKQKERHTVNPTLISLKNRQHANGAARLTNVLRGLTSSDGRSSDQVLHQNQSDSQFNRSYTLLNVPDNSDERSVPLNEESADASSFCALPASNNITITSQADESSATQGQQLQQNTANTMTFAELPEVEIAIDDANDQKPESDLDDQQQTPDNFTNKLKVAMINLSKEDVKLSQATGQGRFTVGLETSQNQTVSLLGDTIGAGSTVRLSHQNQRLGHSLGSFSSQADCTVQTNVINICISNCSQDDRKKFNSTFQAHAAAATATAAGQQTLRLKPQPSYLTNSTMQANPYTNNSFLSKASSSAQNKALEIKDNASVLSQVYNYFGSGGGDSKPLHSVSPQTIAKQKSAGIVIATSKTSIDVKQKSSVLLPCPIVDNNILNAASSEQSLQVSPLVSGTKTATSARTANRKSKTRNSQQPRSEVKSYLSPLFSTQKVTTPQTQLASQRSIYQTKSLFMNGTQAIEPPSTNYKNMSASPYAQHKASPIKKVPMARPALKSSSPKRDSRRVAPQIQPSTQMSKTSAIAIACMGPNEQKSLPLFAKPKYSADVARHVVDVQSLKSSTAMSALNHSKSSATIKTVAPTATVKKKSSTLQRTSKTLHKAFHWKPPQLVKPTSKPAQASTEFQDFGEAVAISIPDLISETLAEQQPKSRVMKGSSRNLGSKKNSLVKASTGGNAVTSKHNNVKKRSLVADRSPTAFQQRQVVSYTMSRSFQTRSQSQREPLSSKASQRYQVAGVPQQPQLKKPSFNSRMTIAANQEGESNCSSSSDGDSAKNNDTDEKVTIQFVKEKKSLGVEDVDSGAMTAKSASQKSTTPKVVTIHIERQGGAVAEETKLDSNRSTNDQRSSTTRRSRSIRQRAQELQQSKDDEVVVLEDAKTKISTGRNVGKVTPSSFFYPAQGPGGEKPSKPQMPSGQPAQLQQVRGDEIISFSSMSNIQSINLGHSTTAFQQQRQSQVPPKPQELTESQEQIVVTKVTRRKCFGRYHSFEDRNESEPPSQIQYQSSLRDLKAKRVQRTRSLSLQKRLLYQKFLTTGGGGSQHAKSNKSINSGDDDQAVLMQNLIIEQRKSKSYNPVQSSMSDEVKIDLKEDDSATKELQPIEDITPPAIGSKVAMNDTAQQNKALEKQASLKTPQELITQEQKNHVDDDEEEKVAPFEQLPLSPIDKSLNEAPSQLNREESKPAAYDQDDLVETDIDDEALKEDDLFSQEQLVRTEEVKSTPVEATVIRKSTTKEGEPELLKSAEPINLLDKLSMQFEQGMLNLDDDLLCSSNALLIADDLDEEEETLLNFNSIDNGDSTQDDREAILNMLDDPDVNDEIANKPFDLMATPKNKEIGGIFSTPDPQESKRQSNFLGDEFSQRYSQLVGSEENKFSFDLKKSLSIISEEKSAWFKDNASIATSSYYKNGGGPVSISMLSSTFNSAKKSHQQLYLRKNQSSLQKQSRNSEILLSVSSKGGSPVGSGGDQNCNPFLPSIVYENDEEDLQLKQDSADTGRARSKTQGAKALQLGFDPNSNINHESEVRDFNSEQMVPFDQAGGVNEDGATTLQSRPSFPLAEGLPDGSPVEEGRLSTSQ